MRQRPVIRAEAHPVVGPPMRRRIFTRTATRRRPSQLHVVERRFRAGDERALLVEQVHHGGDPRERRSRGGIDAPAATERLFALRWWPQRQQFERRRRRLGRAVVRASPRWPIPRQTTTPAQDASRLPLRQPRANAGVRCFPGSLRLGPRNCPAPTRSRRGAWACLARASSGEAMGRLAAARVTDVRQGSATSRSVKSGRGTGPGIVASSARPGAAAPGCHSQRSRPDRGADFSSVRRPPRHHAHHKCQGQRSERDRYQ